MTKPQWDAGIIADFAVFVTIIILAVVVDIPQI